MLRNTIFAFVIVTVVQSQNNGEFWWLNSKLDSFRKVRPSPPIIDNSDFQNGASAKIVFKDEDLFTNRVLKPSITDRRSKLFYENNSENGIVWPTNEYIKNHDAEVFIDHYTVKECNQETTKPIKLQKLSEDVLVFKYPKNDTHTTLDLNNTITQSPLPASTIQNSPMESESQKANTETQFHHDEMSTITQNDKESQNICTYVSKKVCHQRNGLVYEYSKRVPIVAGEQLTCCILPFEPTPKKDDLSHIIHFPNTPANKNRYKRSDTEETIALKQRDFLLKHRFSNQQKIKPVFTPETKVVTPPEDDYMDPYWNIKNTKFQKHDNPKVENIHDYYSDDDEQEYSDEIPRPGLVGIYSDHAQSPSSWSIVSDNKGLTYGGIDNNDYEEDDNDSTFGYSTIDPRKGMQKQKRPTMKLTTPSDDVIYDAESHTINFQSNPDFQVFQGFKLLNLFRNTSRLHPKKTATNQLDKESTVMKPVNDHEIEEVFDEHQLFNDCGKAARKINGKGNQISETVNGSHPWMALVVLTKRPHNVLCYATLIHPRAAVTVGDCVDGTSPGDITVIAGLWDLNDKSRWKNRVATVRVHPQYKPGDVNHNLAILHWMRPLKLNVNIQPACLGEPQIGDECKFFGWGRLDQGIKQPRPRWQRATIRTCTGRVNNKRAKPTKAFCASTPRVSVTGMGGPLICEVEDRHTVVGVVVTKDNGYVLIPVRDWMMHSGDLLSGD